MPYDTTTFTPLVTTEPSLDGLIAWLETQPRQGTYDWPSCHGACLIGQYMASHGIAWRGDIYARWSEKIFGPNMDDDWGLYAVTTPLPWTFGAALERAKAVRARQEKSHAL